MIVEFAMLFHVTFPQREKQKHVEALPEKRPLCVSALWRNPLASWPRNLLICLSHEKIAWTLSVFHDSHDKKNGLLEDFPRFFVRILPQNFALKRYLEQEGHLFTLEGMAPLQAHETDDGHDHVLT